MVDVQKRRRRHHAPATASRAALLLLPDNLAQVKAYDKDHLLPGRGILYFFYKCESFAWGFDPADRGAARAFYFENTDGLVPLAPPGDFAGEYTIPEIAVKFRSQKSYPGFEEFENYSDLDCDREEYEEALEKPGIDTEKNPEGHKLFGYADAIQGDMLTECERVSRGLYCGDAESYRNTPDDVKAEIAKHAGNRLLLLQLSTITKKHSGTIRNACKVSFIRSNHSICPMMSNTPACPPADIRKVLTA